MATTAAAVRHASVTWTTQPGGRHRRKVLLLAPGASVRVARLTWTTRGTVDGTDLGLPLGAWGPCAPKRVLTPCGVRQARLTRVTGFVRGRFLFSIALRVSSRHWRRCFRGVCLLAVQATLDAALAGLSLLQHLVGWVRAPPAQPAWPWHAVRFWSWLRCIAPEEEPVPANQRVACLRHQAVAGLGVEPPMSSSATEHSSGAGLVHMLATWPAGGGEGPFQARGQHPRAAAQQHSPRRRRLPLWAWRWRWLAGVRFTHDARYCRMRIGPAGRHSASSCCASRGRRPNHRAAQTVGRCRWCWGVDEPVR